jgi:hypothetical protein
MSDVEDSFNVSLFGARQNSLTLKLIKKILVAFPGGIELVFHTENSMKYRSLHPRKILINFFCHDLENSTSRIFANVVFTKS